ncbi:Rgg/GadR/MutR family transcriptional regulator [Limosilactobacillus fermentum]|uniref:Rgg family transcriptional regulator n=1 Tax=Limosilactobacillus fermentum TaxID=1613 RepID=UPI0013C541F4|nr:Rgg/GadR/MutR family transcriptional regulator [Limosilactobacillus fermentum]QID95227.1 Rgg/GadR/MutR family transcriptional regulator [Limosilactobacillus fermentum]
MEYGPTISDIRRGKKVRLEELINGVMNQSSYSRFVDGKTETSVNNFALLLDNLNVTYDEFMMIARGFRPDPCEELFTGIFSALRAGDLPALVILRDQTRALALTATTKVKWINHLACVAQVAYDHLASRTPTPAAKQTLTDYLLECELWTHYETFLFTNLLFLFSAETVRGMQTRLIRNLRRYDTLHPYGNEPFRATIKMILFYLEKQEVTAALETIVELQKFPLRDEMIFERMIQQFVSAMAYTIAGVDQLERIDQTLESLRLTGSIRLAAQLLDHLEEITGANQFTSPHLTALLDHWRQALTE